VGEQDKQPPIFTEAVLVTPDALATQAQVPARVPAQHGIAETTHTSVEAEKAGR